MVESSSSTKLTHPSFLVVGDTGVGKSTFINYLLGRQEAFADDSDGISVTQKA